MDTTDNPLPSSVAQALAAAVALGVERLDAQLLLLHALGRAPHDRAWLLAHDTDAMPEAAWAALAAQLSRRLAGEPVAYLLGEKEFHGLDLKVDARVLVPRPDTETLVEWALECMDRAEGHAAPRVLDLGTGSGAIALALQNARRDAHVDAVDASADALAVAQANALRLACRCASPRPTGSTAQAAATRSSPAIRRTSPPATRTCPPCATSRCPRWSRARTASTTSAGS
jgi:release factor glutamine methyltransferase